ncbi:MAG TPA: tRNA preQ1(34) S-adenosylmethionine ribosyltransferase-isomerase QueA [Alphaproteobacteria bacterium]|nr:tRNA preQ1(34) S-adenosylmethionine ribosyltransferase-isomerase QueA [Alphaproteobacteria bacterium]
MRVDDFDFELPRDLIAARPAEPRDAARLLEVRGEALGDHVFGELPGLLCAGDLLVFNDTKVIPARLTGRRGEAKIEATLHKREGPGRWRAFARPAKRLKPGDRIVFAVGFEAEVAAKGEAGEVTLDFALDDAAMREALGQHGAMPLPPYIPRPAGPDARDVADYQTVYAAREGAVAAPTAGLHFTQGLLGALDAAGIGATFVTLTVGAGTFLPVKAERVADHVMHAEWGHVSDEAARAVAKTKAAGGRVVAVGTTSLRLLESAAGTDATDGAVASFEGETDIFITPGFGFRAADLLITNFHLPRSTLFMLVAAFSGLACMKAAYDHAISGGYRFYSYGDACLLHRNVKG